jgi:hypothetical protein
MSVLNGRSGHCRCPERAVRGTRNQRQRALRAGAGRLRARRPRSGPDRLARPAARTSGKIIGGSTLSVSKGRRRALAQVKPVSYVAEGTIRTFNVRHGTLATSTSQRRNSGPPMTLVERPERARASATSPQRDFAGP